MKKLLIPLLMFFFGLMSLTLLPSPAETKKKKKSVGRASVKPPKKNETPGSKARPGGKGNPASKGNTRTAGKNANGAVARAKAAIKKCVKGKLKIMNDYYKSCEFCEIKDKSIKEWHILMERRVFIKKRTLGHIISYANDIVKDCF